MYEQTNSNKFLIINSLANQKTLGRGFKICHDFRVFRFLNLASLSSNDQKLAWLRDPDSNREPQGYEPCELPIALSRDIIPAGDSAQGGYCLNNYTLKL